MARLPYLTRDDLPPADHALLDRDLNLYAVLAHSPAAARAFGAPALYVRHDSALDPRLRELAILQIGYATGTRYEYVHHVEIGLANGLTAAENILRRLNAPCSARHANSSRAPRSGTRLMPCWRTHWQRTA
jgi:alkylhydroperoxidase family enzyme